MAHASGIPVTDSGQGSGAPDGAALTYDLEAADAAVRKRSQLRLMLNDIEAGRGPRPGGRNFTDTELDNALELEGGNLNRAAALAYEILTAAWASQAERVGLGPQTYESSQARRYRELATMFRKQYGHGRAGGGDDGQFVSWAGSFAEWWPH
jgi:hypothetical protein